MERKYDTRSFAEIWHSLPQAAKDILNERFRKKGISAQCIYRWLHGATPKRDSMKKLQQAILSSFGIRTLPYTLFPETSEREEIENRLNKKHKEETGWDGKVNWPSIEAYQNAEPNPPGNPEY